MIINGKITLEKVNGDQNEFKSNLTKIRTVKNSDEQKSELKNIETLFISRHNVIKLFDGFLQ